MLDNIIIIPYRDREEHLQYFLGKIVPLLQKHIPNGKVVIVEQDWNNKFFNRGCLLNIGFKEYENKTNYYVCQDLDICPNETCIKEIYLNKNFDVIRGFVGHNISLGGVCRFTHKSIHEVNGFPNYIWGWGIEDRALFYRYNIMKQKISPNYTSKYSKHFTKLPHKHNGSNTHPNNRNISNNENNIFKSNDYKKQVEHIMSSGLNNLQYTIIERKDINDYVELIKVSI